MTPERDRIVPVGLRLVMTPILLSEVWRHAHWSVALALTLLSVANEVRSWKK